VYRKQVLHSSASLAWNQPRQAAGYAHIRYDAQYLFAIHVVYYDDQFCLIKDEWLIASRRPRTIWKSPSSLVG
jgi:hypothetical protein